MVQNTQMKYYQSLLKFTYLRNLNIYYNKTKTA